MDHLKTIKAKIFSGFETFEPVLLDWKKDGAKIVFTNGCFDLIHRGHVESLTQAAALGDKLIIGLNSDSSVEILKGQGHPLISEESRAILLASFMFVDAVILFSEETPYNLIAQIVPNVLVKGNEYAIEEIAGFDVVLANGGKVIPLELVPGFSTSSLITKIRNLKNE